MEGGGVVSEGVEGGAEGIHTRLLSLVHLRVFSCTPHVLHVPSRACPVRGTHTLPDLAPTVNLNKIQNPIIRILLFRRGSIVKIYPEQARGISAANVR